MNLLNLPRFTPTQRATDQATLQAHCNGVTPELRRLALGKLRRGLMSGILKPSAVSKALVQGDTAIANLVQRAGRAALPNLPYLSRDNASGSVSGGTTIRLKSAKWMLSLALAKRLITSNDLADLATRAGKPALLLPRLIEIWNSLIACYLPDWIPTQLPSNSHAYEQLQIFPSFLLTEPMYSLTIGGCEVLVTADSPARLLLPGENNDDALLFEALALVDQHLRLPIAWLAPVPTAESIIDITSGEIVHDLLSHVMRDEDGSLNLDDMIVAESLSNYWGEDPDPHVIDRSKKLVLDFKRLTDSHAQRANSDTLAARGAASAKHADFVAAILRTAHMLPLLPMPTEARWETVTAAPPVMLVAEMPNSSGFAAALDEFCQMEAGDDPPLMSIDMAGLSIADADRVLRRIVAEAAVTEFVVSYVRDARTYK